MITHQTRKLGVCAGSTRRKHSLHATQPHQKRRVARLNLSGVAFSKLPEAVSFSALNYLNWRRAIELLGRCTHLRSARG